MMQLWVGRARDHVLMNLEQPRGALHREFIKVLPVCACMSYVVPCMLDVIVWHVSLQLVYDFIRGALPCDILM